MKKKAGRHVKWSGIRLCQLPANRQAPKLAGPYPRLYQSTLQASSFHLPHYYYLSGFLQKTYYITIAFIIYNESRGFDATGMDM